MIFYSCDAEYNNSCRISLALESSYGKIIKTSKDVIFLERCRYIVNSISFLFFNRRSTASQKEYDLFEQIEQWLLEYQKDQTKEIYSYPFLSACIRSAILRWQAFHVLHSGSVIHPYNFFFNCVVFILEPAIPARLCYKEINNFVKITWNVGKHQHCCVGSCPWQCSWMIGERDNARHVRGQLFEGRFFLWVRR